MFDLDTRNIHQKLADRALLEKALAEATERALQQHKGAGNAVAVWREGGVVTLQAEDIALDESALQTYRARVADVRQVSKIVRAS